MNEIKITKKRLEELEEAESLLDALKAGGVDNWEWYSESLGPYLRDKNMKKLISETLIDIEVAILSDAFEPSERGAGHTTTDEARSNAESILSKMLKTYFSVNEGALDKYDN